MALKNSLIKQGLPGKLGIANFTLLSTLAALSNEKGVCRVDTYQLAKILDITPQSVSRRLSEVSKFELDGLPIVQRAPGGLKIAPEVFYGTQNCSINNSKSINNISSNKNINAVTVLEHFCAKYEEAYDTPYNFLRQRDLSLIKNKLLLVYGSQNTLKIIDEAFRQRSLFENPPKYPYITIGGLVTFIANKIATDIAQKEKLESRDVATCNKEMMEKYWDDYFGN